MFYKIIILAVHFLWCSRCQCFLIYIHCFLVLIVVLNVLSNLTNVLQSHDVIGHVTEQNVCEKHVLESNIRVVLINNGFICCKLLKLKET